VAEKPVLLFLHGVGEGDQDDRWREALAAALVDVGYPGLDAVTVVAPKYAKALRGVDEKLAVPELTVKTLSGQAARANRREFQRRQGALEVRMVRHDAGVGWFGGETLAAAALRFDKFVQAKNYLVDPHVRAVVLDRVLRSIPQTGRLVIVGHSLGSVIAADLVRRLPAEVDVVGMVTIGSPLAHAAFNVDGIRTVLKEPPANLGWWVNFWNNTDPVTAHRGVSSVLPWVLDQRVRTKVDHNVHFAQVYLADTKVASAIGYALHGSTSRELVAAESGVDIPLDYAETVALMALRSAYLTMTKLEGEHRARFTSALRYVQANTVDLISQRNAREGRPLPAAIADLAVDLSDPESVAPEPSRIYHLAEDDAIVPLTSLVATNVIRPFEINVPEDTILEVLEDLTIEMGLGRQFGRDAYGAAEEASKALATRGANWLKWVALGVGAAAVLATGGMAVVAAPAGLAGAAAITSALAAFGPGGMVGGLLTAGALVSVSTGGLAVGLASPATSPETVEAVVSTQLAAEILRRRRGLEPDPSIWSSLIETANKVRRERAQLEVISDESSPSLKDLKRKLDVIDRALSYLTAHGLGPDGLAPVGDAATIDDARIAFRGKAADLFRRKRADGASGLDRAGDSV
jgi:hypothetical protein